MNQKNQIVFFVALLAIIAVSIIIVLPNRNAIPGKVEVTSTETGETELVSDYEARYAAIPHSRTEDGGFVLGKPDAPVTIVEFADFLCPHCQEYQETARQFIEQDVATGKAKFEYRLFPIVSAELSPFAAQLAECADTLKPGLFWAAHDMLYDLAARGQISKSVTPQVVADGLGLETAALSTCAENAKQYETDQAAGEKVGVSGTPATMVRLEDGSLAWAFIEGKAYTQGGMPLTILEKVINAEKLSDVVFVPEPLLDQLAATSDSQGDCAIPCWRGIHPGETAWEDASAIVQAGKEFSDFQEQADPSGAKVLQWTSIEGIQCCQMLSVDGTKVDEIFLLSSTTVPLGEVITARGEPGYAVTRDTRSGGLLVNLFYVDEKLLLYVFVDGNTADQFTADSEVVGVSYLSAERMTKIVTELEPSPWTGYADVLAYRPPTATPTEVGQATEEAATPEAAQATAEMTATP